jgi:hypothetical protein
MLGGAPDSSYIIASLNTCKRFDHARLPIFKDIPLDPARAQDRASKVAHRVIGRDSDPDLPAVVRWAIHRGARRDALLDNPVRAVDYRDADQFEVSVALSGLPAR